MIFCLELMSRASSDRSLRWKLQWMYGFLLPVNSKKLAWKCPSVVLPVRFIVDNIRVDEMLYTCAVAKLLKFCWANLFLTIIYRIPKLKRKGPGAAAAKWRFLNHENILGRLEYALQPILKISIVYRSGLICAETRAWFISCRSFVKVTFHGCFSHLCTLLASVCKINNVFVFIQPICIEVDESFYPCFSRMLYM